MSALRGRKVGNKQLTVRERLHSKFPLNPPCNLHDLTKARENIIILKEIKKAHNPEDARVSYTRKYIPKDLQKLRLLNRIEARLYVHLHEVQLWSNKGLVIGDIFPGRYGKGMSYRHPDGLLEIRRVL